MKIIKVAFLLLANILPQTVPSHKLRSTWLILAWESARKDLNMKGNIAHSISRILLLIYYWQEINHREVGAGRDLWRSSSPTSLLKHPITLWKNLQMSRVLVFSGQSIPCRGPFVSVQSLVQTQSPIPGAHRLLCCLVPTRDQAQPCP